MQGLFHYFPLEDRTERESPSRQKRVIGNAITDVNMPAMTKESIVIQIQNAQRNE